MQLTEDAVEYHAPPAPADAAGAGRMSAAGHPPPRPAGAGRRCGSPRPGCCARSGSSSGSLRSTVLDAAGRARR